MSCSDVDRCCDDTGCSRFENVTNFSTCYHCYVCWKRVSSGVNSYNKITGRKCHIIMIIITNIAVPICSSETDSALQCLDDFRKQMSYRAL